MNIVVGTNDELKDLYRDEETLMELIDKCEHAVRVNPRNMEAKATILSTRHELLALQSRIERINIELNAQRKAS